MSIFRGCLSFREGYPFSQFFGENDLVEPLVGGSFKIPAFSLPLPSWMGWWEGCPNLYHGMTNTPPTETRHWPTSTPFVVWVSFIVTSSRSLVWCESSVQPFQLQPKLWWFICFRDFVWSAILMGYKNANKISHFRQTAWHMTTYQLVHHFLHMRCIQVVTRVWECQRFEPALFYARTWFYKSTVQFQDFFMQFLIFRAL